jgi:hypothetical protein
LQISLGDGEDIGSAKVEEVNNLLESASPELRVERGQILANDIVDLDGRRGMAAQKATGMRRQLAAVEADHAALRARQEELEHFLLAAPATDWGEAVAKARYLLILFAQTPAAEDLRRAKLIANVFADFERLLAEPKRPPRRG